ncbi:MAG: hypothetical protein HY901_06810 [Deltaproteobacteria bacterium]|nr:hypothetical protein [Deltaproteobacteria bacterium]
MDLLGQPGVRLGLLLAVSLAVSAPLSAWAARASTPSDQARALIEEAEFEQALKVINEALSQADLTDAALLSLYELQGTAQLFLGNRNAARQSFERLLQVQPSFELPKGTSAKIRALFQEVAESAQFKPVKLTHQRLSAAPAGDRLDVPAQISDLPKGAKARLYYRRGGSEGYSSTSFVLQERSDYLARIPAFEVPAESSDYVLEYYLEVGDSTGRRLAGIADALDPIKVRISARPQSAGDETSPAVVEASEAWYQKWWVWTIVGAVAVGAGVAVVVPLMSNGGAELPVTVRIQQ